MIAVVTGIVPRHWLALLTVALEHARRRPVQSGLLVLGVALGVAVGVAIDLANASAMAAFRLSTETIAGRATHRIVGGPQGLDEDVYRALRVDLAVRQAAPVVEGAVRVPALGGEELTLLGVDPFAEPPFRDLVPFGGEVDTAADGAAPTGTRSVPAGSPGADGDRAGPDPAEGRSSAVDPGSGPAAGSGSLTAFLTVPDAIIVSEGLAGRAAVGVGDLLALDTGTRTVTATVAAVVRPADDLARRALDGLIVVDVATAQEMLGRIGRLDRVDLMLSPDPAAAREASRRLAGQLPPGVTIVPTGEDDSTIAAMTDAFRLNLTALSLLALLVGMFLIFNTVRFSVVQRRRTLATLRVLGVTRREIVGLVLAEATVLGLIGSVAGVALGVALGQGAVRLVTQTINDLFFATTVRGVTVPITTLVRGVLLGTGAALLAALVPALEATSISPVAALRRSDAERAARRAVPWALAGGLVLAVAGVVLLALPGGRIDVAFAALFAIVLAFALAAPAVTLVLMALVTPLAGRLLGPIGRMAPRDVSRSLSRTGVAIAALMVAVCVSIGVQVMVGSFRLTVERWLAQTLQADVFVSPRAVTATRAADRLDPGLLAEIVALPDVASHSTATDVAVRSPTLGPVQLLAVRTDLAGDDRRYLDAVGPPGATWSAVTGGAVIVSEPFARRHGLAVGDTVDLQTDRGARAFPVAGIFYDYGSNTGVVWMADTVYRAHWDDARVTSVALIAGDGVDVEALVAEVRTLVAGRQALNVRSNRGLRTEVLTVFDRAFAITGALRVLAIAVAFIGVLSSLLALQLERAREHATLRATGMTREQLAALNLVETGLVGAVAGLLSWPAGLTLALLLIYVVNRRSFGWTIEPTVTAGPFVMALALSIGAALLAGLLPAWRLGRLPLARSLREE